MLSDKKINELITGIYNASDSSQYWGDILQMLCELLPGARAAIVHRDKKTSGVLLCQQIQPHTYTANIDADFASQYQQYHEKDIWTQLNKQLNPGESVVDSSRAFRVCSTYMSRKTIIESDLDIYVGCPSVEGRETSIGCQLLISSQTAYVRTLESFKYASNFSELTQV